MAAAPAYAANPRSLDLVQVSAANTNRDGTGTIVTCCTGATAGTRVSSVTAQAIVTTTAGMIRLFLSTDTGTTWRLWDELPVSANSVGANIAGVRIRREYSDLVLFGASDLLGASTHNAEALNIVTLAMDL